MTAHLSRRTLLRAAGWGALGAGAGGLVAAPAAAAPGAEAPAAAALRTWPVSVYPTTVHGDPADVYHPRLPRHGRLPVALLLQGANVDKANYAGFARRVAAHGLAVVVPNHRRVVMGQPGLFVTGEQAAWTVEWAAAEDARVDSPLRGALDPQTLLLLGHSFGGAAGLSLTTGLCTPPFCDAPTPAPPQLRAAAFYGTNFAVPGAPGIPPIANIVPVALVQGSVDGIGSPANGLATFQALVKPPKLYVSVLGANHYGVTDGQNPAGARPDPSPQTLDQAASVAAAARWSAAWLRAQLGDPVAAAWVYRWGDVLDRTVTTQVVR
jgi:predicted dienelactone hydrolase